MERNVAARRTVQGVVVSDKNAKTIVVLVETHKRHSKYGKRVKYGKKYYAHDENCEAKVGDTVTIMECRRLSALKRFRLVSVDKKAVLTIKEAEAELKAEVLEAEQAPVEEKVEEVKAEAEKPAAGKADAEEGKEEVK
ncbi:MAG: 30S ribosomal protein S17 [Bacilli bacterium]|nr:30S ribosomal protein S17 [Bacilli bacterium]